MGIQGIDGLNLNIPNVPNVDTSNRTTGSPFDQSGFDGVTDNAKVASALGAQPGAPGWQSLLPPGWNPSMGVTPAANDAQKHDLSYIKMVMAETAVMTGHANTSDADMQKAYDYWIPKMLTIGNPPGGCDDYWVGRLLQPDTGGATSAGGSTGSAGDDALMSAIQSILDGPGSDKDKAELIKKLLAQHGKLGGAGGTASVPAGG
jgi:hypothetical protein